MIVNKSVQPIMNECGVGSAVRLRASSFGCKVPPGTIAMLARDPFVCVVLWAVFRVSVIGVVPQTIPSCPVYVTAKYCKIGGDPFVVFLSERIRESANGDRLGSTISVDAAEAAIAHFT